MKASMLALSLLWAGPAVVAGFCATETVTSTTHCPPKPTTCIEPNCIVVKTVTATCPHIPCSPVKTVTAYSSCTTTCRAGCATSTSTKPPGICPG